MPDPNLPLLEDAVRKLAPFLDEIVFVGGITLGLLITDEAAAPIRGTTDVDVIAEIVTYADYIAFSERLRQSHFTEDAGERPLTCRWHNGTLTLDVLALNKDVLGFTNIWYEPALRHASTHMLPGGQSIRVITAPFFLETKMEAFRGRGRMDFQASHDLEDFVAVIEGRETVVQEIAVAPQTLQDSLAEAARTLLAESRFLDVLPGFVLDSERGPQAFDRKGSYEQGVGAGRNATKFTPANAEAHLWLGEALRKANQCPEATPEYSQYLSGTNPAPS